MLAADPQNAKAKALHDLSAIKLSKRKLYKKIAGRNPLLHRPTAPPSPTLHRLPLTPRTHGSHWREVQVAARRQFPLPNPHSRVIEPRPRRRGLPESDGAPPDSMRERTISALVDLLKNTDATLQDWKGDYQSKTGSPTPTPASLSPHEPAKPATAENAADSSSGMQRSQPSGQHPAALPDEQHERAVLKANRDFLPGSLDELFEAKREKPAVLPQVEPRPPVVATGNTVQNGVPSPDGFQFPARKSDKDSKATSGTTSHGAHRDTQKARGHSTASAAVVSTTNGQERHSEKAREQLSGHTAALTTVSGNTACYPASRYSHFRPDYGSSSSGVSEGGRTED